MLKISILKNKNKTVAIKENRTETKHSIIWGGGGVGPWAGKRRKWCCLRMLCDIRPSNASWSLLLDLILTELEAVRKLAARANLLTPTEWLGCSPGGCDYVISHIIDLSKENQMHYF